MIHPLEVVIPKDLHKALTCLSEGSDVLVIAGGTDVVPGLGQGSNRFKNARMLVDINNIKELKGISFNNDIVTIGAAETFTNILDNSIIKNKLPLLIKACGTIGSVQIRNRATIGGNFVNNAPCADAVPVLLAYNATILIESLNSKREIALAEFLNGPYRTQLKKDEIVTQINIPVPVKEFTGDFYKLGRRRAVAISRITLALLVSIKENTIDEIRIASGAVTPIGIRFTDLEKSVTGKVVDENLLKDISANLGKRILDAAGLRWSSEYKLPVVQQVFYQMLYKSIYGGGND
jgi:carbon-monoxide dehydrogenase medium subunit/xanthine dehydrogenase FAD-binding subunit